MAGIRDKAMTRGAILFAFNTQKYDYYSMAVYAAKRINYFLNLPVTIVTNHESVQTTDYMFDNTILVEADTSNNLAERVWINKGRFQAYDLSPYDETLLLDTDYVVNSNKLLKTFSFSEDFCCHNRTNFLMQSNMPQEALSIYSVNALWATVVMFKKTKKSKQLFECIEMIQKNYEHYSLIHGFVPFPYRNDYALTLASRMVNGHLESADNYIPWSLIHVNNSNHVYKTTDNMLDIEFMITHENTQRGKTKMEYITIRDMDFHMLNKDNFMEIIQ